MARMGTASANFSASARVRPVMDAVRAIYRLVDSMFDAFNRGLSAGNRLLMALWAAQVERIIRTPPGSDEGFAAEQIDEYSRADLSRSTTWAIVCEEVLDTTFPRVYFDIARAELRRRGISDDEYTELRRFAWLTAGWMNSVRMLWEWQHLDEVDVRRAIEWQFREGWISGHEHDRRLAFVSRYQHVPESGG